ncbi:F-box protein-like protein [Paramyrothecium foliicola]|nr:F-box protein-like protein [Paramyrothecium foliicola]
MHGLVTGILYRDVTIRHSQKFRKYFNTITNKQKSLPLTAEELASTARRLDFSHFSPFAAASSRAAQCQDLNNATISLCLRKTKNLREFLVQEDLDDAIGVGVLHQLFFGLQRLEAVDFSGCSSVSFKEAFDTVFAESCPVQFCIKRLSFHRCFTLSPPVFDAILSRLHNLTHLDVGHTHIKDSALLSIPLAARITHLNISYCGYLTPYAIVGFVARHPATRDSLIYLNIASSSHFMESDDVSTILEHLPDSVRSLNMKGSQMNKVHIQQLRKLICHLTELAVGRGLTLSDVRDLFLHEDTCLRHSLCYLDLSDMDFKLSTANPLLAPITAPLLEIELNERHHAYGKWANFFQVGWTVKKYGTRTSITRWNWTGIEDMGWQQWNYGRVGWGRRKIPVSATQIGPMYRWFMYGTCG